MLNFKPWRRAARMARILFKEGKQTLLIKTRLIHPSNPMRRWLRVSFPMWTTLKTFSREVSRRTSMRETSLSTIKPWTSSKLTSTMATGTATKITIGWAIHGTKSTQLTLHTTYSSTNSRRTSNKSIRFCRLRPLTGILVSLCNKIASWVTEHTALNCRT